MTFWKLVVQLQARHIDQAINQLVRAINLCNHPSILHAAQCACVVTTDSITAAVGVWHQQCIVRKTGDWLDVRNNDDIKAMRHGVTECHLPPDTGGHAPP